MDANARVDQLVAVGEPDRDHRRLGQLRHPMHAVRGPACRLGVADLADQLEHVGSVEAGDQRGAPGRDAQELAGCAGDRRPLEVTHQGTHGVGVDPSRQHAVAGVGQVAGEIAVLVEGAVLRGLGGAVRDLSGAEPAAHSHQ